MDNINHNIDDPRYVRQVTLGAFGRAGQERLLRAKVLVVGAGGLGCGALPYLAGAGVGTIGIVDDDAVALHNLHRQVLYTVDDIGQNKAITAAAQLRRLNPGIAIEAIPDRLTVINTLDLFSRFDLVIDGTDNFATRYMINDACLLLRKPLVYGSVSGMEGQVAIFCTPGADGTITSYRDLFPAQPVDSEFPNCAEAGVLGVLPGVIGGLQAAEAIKFLAKTGQPLVSRLLTCNLAGPMFLEIAIRPNKGAAPYLPASPGAFRAMDYGHYCAGNTGSYGTITAAEFAGLCDQPGVLVVDVREEGEEPKLETEHRRVPLRQLPGGLDDVQADTIVLVCQSGKRSAQAAAMLAARYGTDKQIFSLAGGIQQLQQA